MQVEDFKTQLLEEVSSKAVICRHSFFMLTFLQHYIGGIETCPNVSFLRFLPWHGPLKVTTLYTNVASHPNCKMAILITQHPHFVVNSRQSLGLVVSAQSCELLKVHKNVFFIKSPIVRYAELAHNFIVHVKSPFQVISSFCLNYVESKEKNEEAFSFPYLYKALWQNRGNWAEVFISLYF